MTTTTGADLADRRNDAGARPATGAGAGNGRGAGSDSERG